MSRSRCSARAERLSLVFVILITIAFGLTASVLLWAKWRNFDPFLFDFARGTRVFERLLEGVPHEYSMHYYLMFYMGVYPAILPLYALFRSIAVIFAVHVASFSLAIPLLYAIARQMLPGCVLPLVVVLAYALNPTIDVTAISFMRLESPWIVCFLLTIYLVGRHAYGAALLTATLACIVRIDAAPALFLLGVSYFMRRRKPLGLSLMRRAALVVASMIIGMVVFRFSTGIPFHFEQFHLTAMFPEGKGSVFGLLSGLISILTDPGSYVYFRVLCQFLLIPLFAPTYLLPLLFSAAYIVLSTKSFLSLPIVSAQLKPDSFLVPFLHVHDVYVFPILFVGMIAALSRLCRWVLENDWVSREKHAYFRAGVAALLGGAFLAMHWFFTPQTLGPVPLTSCFNADYYRPTPHSRLAWEVLDEVPKDVPGLLQGSFADRAYRLVHAREVHPNTQFEADTEYALFDMFAFSAHMPKEDLLRKIEDLVGRGDVGVARFEDGILLVERKKGTSDNQRVIEYIQHNRAWLSRNEDK